MQMPENRTTGRMTFLTVTPELEKCRKNIKRKDRYQNRFSILQYLRWTTQKFLPVRSGNMKAYAFGIRQNSSENPDFPKKAKELHLPAISLKNRLPGKGNPEPSNDQFVPKNEKSEKTLIPLPLYLILCVFKFSRLVQKNLVVIDEKDKIELVNMMKNEKPCHTY